LQKASATASKLKFDVILANINKNVILENFKVLRDQLKEGGNLVLSGLLETDREEILEAAKELNLTTQKSLIRNNWIAIQLSK